MNIDVVKSDDVKEQDQDGIIFSKYTKSGLGCARHGNDIS